MKLRTGKMEDAISLIHMSFSSSGHRSEMQQKHNHNMFVTVLKRQIIDS